MLTTLVRWMACSAGGCALLVLAACNPSPNASAPTASTPAAQEQAPTLAGGPPPAAAKAVAAALAAPVKPAAPAKPAAMALAAQQPAAGQAPSQPSASELAWMRAHHWQPYADGLITRHGTAGVITVTMTPIPNPKAAAPEGGAVLLARADHTGPASPAALKAALDRSEPSDQDRMGQLSAAVAREMRNARLEFAPSDSSGPARVSLSLPDTLAAAIQAEAAKLGMADEARSISVTVKLGGGAKDVTPLGAQSAKLTPGQGADFAWQAPTGAGTLTADITGSLDGAGGGKAFPLGALIAQASAVTAPATAPVQTAAAAPASQAAARAPMSLAFLALPGYPVLDLPGLGPTPSQNVVAGVILAVLLLALAAIARTTADRRERAERRRIAHVFDGAAGEEAAAGHDGHGGDAFGIQHAHAVQDDQSAHDAFTLQPGEAAAVSEDQGAHAHAHTPLASTVYYDVGDQAEAQEPASADFHGHAEQAHAGHDEEAHAPA